MRLEDIKRRIFEEEKIEQLLEVLGCHNIKCNGKNYTASLPDGDNAKSVQVKNDERLLVNVWTREIKGDIFNLIAYIGYGATTKEESKPYIRACIQIIREYLFDNDDAFDELDMKPKRKKPKEKEEFQPNRILDERVLNEYIPHPHIDFLKDGIVYDTQKIFEIGFDLRSGRITIPIRNSDGELVGVKGRRTKVNESDEYKYLFLHNCNKSIELYNLHNAIEHIRNKNEALVFESEKSVMLAWQWGFRNCVATMGKHVSDFQIEILKYLNVNITIAFDKDTQTDEFFTELKSRIGDEHDMYVITDVLGKQNDHDAPVDLGQSYWKKLYENKKIIQRGVDEFE